MLGILIITAAIGCLPNIKHIRLDQNEISSLKVKDLAVTKRVAPQFYVTTSGHVCAWWQVCMVADLPKPIKFFCKCTAESEEANRSGVGAPQVPRIYRTRSDVQK